MDSHPPELTHSWFAVKVVIALSPILILGIADVIGWSLRRTPLAAHGGGASGGTLTGTRRTDRGCCSAREAAGRLADRPGARQPKSVSADGMRLSSLPSWAIWSIVAAALLSPVLAFLMAIAVEILIGALMDAGMLEISALAAVGAVGWFQVRKLRPRLGRSAAVET